MSIHNADIANIFEEIADLLEIEGANPFRIRAYRNAARTIQTMAQDIKILIDQGEDLKKIHSIGKDLEAKIREIINTEECKTLLDLQKRVPAALSNLLKVPGLGPRRVQTLHKELGINTPKQLEQAIRKGQVRQLAGFGQKIEEKILHALEAHAEKKRRFTLAIAGQYAEPLAAYLKSIKDVSRVAIAGSYRRQKEAVGDIDILAIASKNSPVIERFTTYDEVANVVSKGTTRASIILRCGLQVDLRVVEKQSLGAALQYFTGSKAHNIAIRRLGQQRGLKINEYGVFKKDQRVAGNTEKSVYHAVGLPLIPEELRENRGEIEAAQQNVLPKLIKLPDLKGDLHMHTRASDGRDTIKQMVDAAQQYGFQYIAITEHSKSLPVAHGLDANDLAKQIEEIDRINEKLKGIQILKGIEVEILEDGSLDLPNSILGKLDLVVGAVHSKFNLTRAKQTRRIMCAINHRYFSILAHPSGRLLTEREPYSVDMSRVIREAKNRGCFLELNTQPKRLDLIDRHCQTAKNEGVLICINSDAHDTNGFNNLRFGIGQARRGWLTARDVVNTRPINQFRKLLKSTMQ